MLLYIVSLQTSKNFSKNFYKKVTVSAVVTRESSISRSDFYII